MSGLTDEETPSFESEAVEQLAQIAADLESSFPTDVEAWFGSPFRWILSRPSRTVGAIGERLVSAWASANGLDVQRSPDSDADRLFNGRRIEIKFSRLWKTGLYKFQQFRDQNYEFAICLGFSPFDAHAWVIPKTLIMDRWGEADGFPLQHRGKSGSDTAWLSVKPHAVQPWLTEYGGTLDDALAILTAWE